MDKDTFLASFERDGKHLAAVARANPTTKCTSCPDWDMAGLVSHVLWVYSFVDGVVSTRAESPVPPDVPDYDSTEAMFDAFEAKHTELLATLEAADPAEPMWTWIPNKTASFFHRRMAHETAVHHWDAASSLGEATEIDSALAADGIDEVIEVSMQYSSRGKRFDYPAGSLHLHRTDGDGEWMLQAADDGTLVVAHEHGKGDAAVRGSAEGLYLYLWGRRTDGLDFFGDESVAEAWSRVAS